MKIFYYLSKKFSYTFALCFITIMGGWMGAVFAYFLGTSFILSSYAVMTDLIIKWLPLSVLIPTMLHYILFGLLTPIKIPAFISQLRIVNNCFHGDRLNTNIDDTELTFLYKSFSDLPLYNTIIASLGSMLAGSAVLAFISYEYFIIGSIHIHDVKLAIRVVSLSVIIVVILYAMSTYLLTEIITDHERAACYKELLKRGIDQYPRVVLSLRVKFSFFVVLMVIILLTFAAMMQKIVYYKSNDLTEIVAYFIISIAAGVFLMLINTNSIFRILKDMSRVASELASGEKAVFKLHSHDKESAEIEYSVLKMAQEIDGHRKNLELKVEQRTEELQEVLSDLKERDDLIQKQLDMASIIQRSILPGHIDDWNELKFAIRYIAMEKIGGDFYDVYQLKDDKLGIIVADVSGHGIPAALVTTMAKISFGNACMNYDSPRRIFQEVNQNILDHVKTQDYLTCFLIAIDDEYNITYGNASHQKAILIRTEQGEVELLDTDGLFIGAIEDARETYEEKTTKLNFGDRLVLYTDGIPEATNAEREEYSTKRFEELLIKNRHLPLEEFTSYIIEDVQRFIGNAPVEDDVTLLVIELTRDEAIDIIKSSKKMVNDEKFYEAIEHLEKGMSLYPENIKLTYNLAKNYFRVNNFGKTVEYMLEYIEHDKRNKYAYYVAGSAYYMMMDYNKSIELFEKSLSIDSNFASALFAIGIAYKKNNQKAEAIRNLEKAASIDPDNRIAIYELNELKGTPE